MVRPASFQIIATIAALCASLCAPALAANRVVSLDYCADQYVLKFVPRANIVALSPDATRPFSFMRAEAAGLPSVKPIAEDLLLTRPDTVVRSYGGGAGINQFLTRFDIDVVDIGYAMNLADIQHTILETSAALGQAQKGKTVVRDMAAQLARIAAKRPSNNNLKALYMTPTGYTAGPGTIIDELMLTAGLANFHAQPGWHPLPLERLIYAAPEVTVQALFDTVTNYASAWSAMSHPVAERARTIAIAVPIQGAWTSCGGWFVTKAVAAMSEVLTTPGADQPVVPNHDQ